MQNEYFLTIVDGQAKNGYNSPFFLDRRSKAIELLNSFESFRIHGAVSLQELTEIEKQYKTQEGKPSPYYSPYCNWEVIV